MLKTKVQEYGYVGDTGPFRTSNNPTF